MKASNPQIQLQHTGVDERKEPAVGSTMTSDSRIPRDRDHRATGTSGGYGDG